MKIIAPIRLLAFLILVSVIIPLNAQVLDVIITDIRNTDGRLCIAIFDNNLDYQNETALLTAYIDKETLLRDTVHIEIPIWPGTFGISVLDDEDGDEKMRFSFWGIPREGFGFSNYVLKSSRRPQFDDFSFSVNENEKVAVSVKMKYF